MKELARSVQKATLDFFETMCPVEIELEKIIPLTEDRKIDQIFELVSSVGFGGNLKGNIAIHSDYTTAALITSTLLGIDEIEDPNDVSDTLGEFANIVCGGASNDLANSDIRISISCPTVLKGKKLMARPLRGSQVTTLHYNCAGGSFMIMLSVMQ